MIITKIRCRHIQKNTLQSILDWLSPKYFLETIGDACFLVRNLWATILKYSYLVLKEIKLLNLKETVSCEFISQNKSKENTVTWEFNPLMREFLVYFTKLTLLY